MTITDNTLCQGLCCQRRGQCPRWTMVEGKTTDEADIAIVVRSAAGNEGRVVECLRLATAFELVLWDLEPNEDGPVWHVDEELRWMSEDGAVTLAPFVSDHRLRPLRGLSEDERREILARRPEQVSA